jgi:hypothetical protein
VTVDRVCLDSPSLAEDCREEKKDMAYCLAPSFAELVGPAFADCPWEKQGSGHFSAVGDCRLTGKLQLSSAVAEAVASASVGNWDFVVAAAGAFAVVVACAVAAAFAAGVVIVAVAAFAAAAFVAVAAAEFVAAAASFAVAACASGSYFALRPCEVWAQLHLAAADFQV